MYYQIALQTFYASGTCTGYFDNVSVSAVLDNVADGSTYGRVKISGSSGQSLSSGSLSYSGSTFVKQQASIAGFYDNSAFSYSTTSSSISAWCSSFTIYMPDGSSFSAPATGSSGSPAWSWTGLSSSTTYHFGAYYQVSDGTVHMLKSDNSTSLGSQQWLAQTINGDGRLPLFIDWTITTPSSGTGGGGGSSGGGGGCFSGNVTVKTTGGFAPFGELPAVVEIENETGVHVADLIVHEEAERETVDMGAGWLVTPDHLVKRGGWIPAGEMFAEMPRRVYGGKVYNLHVRDARPEDQHYVLGNGVVAHNIKTK